MKSLRESSEGGMRAVSSSREKSARSGARAHYDNPYKALKALGVPMDSHESDLYVRATPEAVALVKASGWTHMFFQSQIDGQTWIDVAFAFEPFWEAKVSR